jgi:hypothetical protein
MLPPAHLPRTIAGHVFGNDKLDEPSSERQWVIGSRSPGAERSPSSQVFPRIRTGPTLWRLFLFLNTGPDDMVRPTQCRDQTEVCWVRQTDRCISAGSPVTNGSCSIWVSPESYVPELALLGATAPLDRSLAGSRLPLSSSRWVCNEGPLGSGGVSPIIFKSVSGISKERSARYSETDTS